MLTTAQNMAQNGATQNQPQGLPAVRLRPLILAPEGGSPVPLPPMSEEEGRLVTEFERQRALIEQRVIS